VRGCSMPRVRQGQVYGCPLRKSIAFVYITVIVSNVLSAGMLAARAGRTRAAGVPGTAGGGGGDRVLPSAARPCAYSGERRREAIPAVDRRVSIVLDSRGADLQIAVAAGAVAPATTRRIPHALLGLTPGIPANVVRGKGSGAVIGIRPIVQNADRVRDIGPADRDNAAKKRVVINGPGASRSAVAQQRVGVRRARGRTSSGRELAQRDAARSTGHGHVHHDRANSKKTRCERLCVPARSNQRPILATLPRKPDPTAKPTGPSHCTSHLLPHRRPHRRFSHPLRC